MLFALPVLLLICLPIVHGNDVTERITDLNNTHNLSTGNRPLPQRNQTKLTRDDQLLSLLAARRRQIIQSRFKNHLKSIVEITSGSNASTIPKAVLSFPNNTKSINVHLNLSDLLRNSVANSSDEITNISFSSTEANVVNISSPKTTTSKPSRKNGSNSTTSQIPENKIISPSKQSSAMPIIRNILYRRKMSYMNRKLPLDFEQIAFDTLGLSEINKHPEDLVFDNEDSLQVEESSHDKLVYYDVKNNASKKSNNNFEDSSDEMKSMMMNNKTFHKINNNVTSTTTVQPQVEEIKNITQKPAADVARVLTNTEAIIPQTLKPNLTKDKQDIKVNNKNTTRFMSPSLYNYFRPLDVPEEEMQPFLHFGEKIVVPKTNHTMKSVMAEKKKVEITSTVKNEEEINENMDMGITEKTNYENKIPKVSLPITNQKVSPARDYYKSRNVQNKSNDSTVTIKPINKIAHFRNVTRNRGFRNQTIFYHNKPSGIRQTINLRGNSSLADLKPTLVNSVTNRTVLNSTTAVPLLKLTFKENIKQPDVDLNNNNNNKTNKEIIDFESIVADVHTQQSPETLTISPKMEYIVQTESVNNRIGNAQSSTPSEFILKDDTDDLKSSSTKYFFETTSTRVPSTRILSTAVVTSVSIESSKTKQNKTEAGVPVIIEDQIKVDANPPTTTDINDSDATVVAALSNFTLQAFQNKNSTVRNYNITASRNPATVYPHINLQSDSSTVSPLPNRSEINSFSQQKTHTNHTLVVSSQQANKTKFILRPSRRENTTPSVILTEANSTTDFIIHVPDTEMTSTEMSSTKTYAISLAKLSTSTEKTTTEDNKPASKPEIKVRIGSRINLAQDKELAIVSTTTAKSTTSQTTINFTTSMTASSVEQATRQTTPRVFNSTMFNTKPETESELPLATLFSVTDFKKLDASANDTKIKLPGSETVVTRKSEGSIDNIHAAYILAALGFLPMIVIVIYVVRSVMKKKHKNIDDFEAEMHHDSEKKSIIHPVARLPTLVLDPTNRWEFPRAKLRLQTLLGQGNFGQVWKAEADDLKGHVGLTRLVAVKTIKDGAGSKERDDLLKELAIMQKMGSHPNVVTLLGCCTDKEPYLLIMEYVMYGKLLTFLRDHRTRRDYYNFSDDAATLTARDLTVFAYCVARGMEYLSSKGIVHRDLAARNILVDHNKLCKIADFGMSRDVGPNADITEPRQPRNALPVRWMAIESLIYSVFSHKTDVWAFGVLLWEIVTLGSSPYANMSAREVMRLVSEGYRLERPSHCRPELYRLMARAWLADSNQRPGFAELRVDLAAMLDAAPTEGSYVDLESFRADSTVYEIDNCTPRGNYFTVKSRFSEFECDI